MPGCLSVAAGAAKALSAALGKPLVGVHHMVHTYLALAVNVVTDLDSCSMPMLSRHFSPSPQMSYQNILFLLFFLQVVIHCCFSLKIRRHSRS